MSLSSDTIKIITADIYYYSGVSGREEILKVSNLPFEGYSPILVSVSPFTLSISNTGINHGTGTLLLANINGTLDYLVCDVDNSYIFNKRRLVLKVYVNGVVEYTVNGVSYDMTADSEAGLQLRFSDPSAELDQPLVVINAEGTNPYSTDPLDRYKPYNINQLYNDLRLISTGIPSTNPRYEEREQPLPFCIGDVFNYTPLSLDFIYTDNADLYYLIVPPSLNYSVEIHQVKDGGVVLVKQGNEVAGQQPNWKTVPGKPWMIQLLTPVFNNLTMDITVGPTTVKDALVDLINSYPKYGSYVRQASLSSSSTEFDGCNYYIGYVGSCSDSLGAVVQQICSSVSLSLYCKSLTEFEVMRFKIPPASVDVVDPMYNKVSFYSAGRLRDGKFIDRDSSKNTGLISSAGLITKDSDILRTYYNIPQVTGWSTSSMTVGTTLTHYSNTALLSDSSIELFFAPDLTSTTYASIGYLPLLEINTLSTANRLVEFHENSVTGSDVSTTVPGAIQCDTSIGIKNVSGTPTLYIRTGATTFTQAGTVIDGWNYISIQYDSTLFKYTVYLNTNRVAVFDQVLHKGFKFLSLAGTYSTLAYSGITDPSRKTLVSGDIYKVNKPLEYVGKLAEIRITQGIRNTGTTITIPGPSFQASTDRTASAVISYQDIIKGSLSVSKINIPTSAAVYLGYGKNWSSGEQLAGIFTEFPGWKESLMKPEYEIYKANDELITLFRFTPVNKSSLQSTLLIDRTEAELEADYRLSLITKRTIELVMQIHPDLSNLAIGNLVVMKHHRYGMDPYVGRIGIVIGKTTDYVNNSHGIAVLI